MSLSSPPPSLSFHFVSRQASLLLSQVSACLWTLVEEEVLRSMKCQDEGYTTLSTAVVVIPSMSLELDYLLYIWQ